MKTLAPLVLLSALIATTPAAAQRQPTPGEVSLTASEAEVAAAAVTVAARREMSLKTGMPGLMVFEGQRGSGNADDTLTLTLRAASGGGTDVTIVFSESGALGEIVQAQFLAELVFEVGDGPVPSDAVYQVRVEHNHSSGGCRGVLYVAGDRIGFAPYTNENDGFEVSVSELREPVKSALWGVDVKAPERGYKFKPLGHESKDDIVEGIRAATAGQGS